MAAASTIAMATLPLMAYDTGSSPLRGFEVVEDSLIHFDPGRKAVGEIIGWGAGEGLRLRLSKSVYPYEDEHIDAVVFLDPEWGEMPEGRLTVELLNTAGEVLSEAVVSRTAGSVMFFSFDFPDSGVAGEEFVLRTSWRGVRGSSGTAEKSFTVAEPLDLPKSGSVAITVPNSSGVTMEAAPMSVGVPFPIGVLKDDSHLRLVDARGNEHPLQTEVTSRWSRFGSIRWLMADFTVDLDGEPVELQLEYGPEVSRADKETLRVVAMPGGFPAVDAGRLRIDGEGVHYRFEGRSQSQKVLPRAALTGGFVEHENGKVFVMPRDLDVQVEAQGPEKVVLLATGWYETPDGRDQFCQFVTRYVIHRDTPGIRIFHTWIFTGDGNRDRIFDMGWRFPFDADVLADGFLTAFGGDGDWQAGDYLLQYDYDKNEIVGGGEVLSRGERAPGVAAAAGNGVRVVFGARDFWQNYPSELSFSWNGLVFHNWPPTAPFDEADAAHAPATVEDAIRLKFIHGGDMLDFRLPDEFLSGPIYQAATRGIGYEMHWDEGVAESANAQGIARTEEMWLYFANASEPRARAAAVMEGLNEETLRGVVDPVWVAASGAFYEIHHRDVENYPAHEKAYEEIALAPHRWVERVGLYGMWLYGENLWNPYLERGSAQLYRGLRKSHHRWPYSWIPYVRSGDPRFLKYAHAGTRHMYDANFCHYVSEEVANEIGSDRARRRGIWHQSLVPWAGRNRGPSTRNYSNQMDYLWHAYYVAGDRRAREVVDLWREEVKIEEDLPARGPIPRSARISTAALHTFVEMYEATGEPWFLAGAHALAERDLEDHEKGRLQPHPIRDYWFWRDWRPAQREYMRLTGDPAWKEFTLDFARDRGSENYAGWAGQGQVEANATGWALTGEDYFLRRLAHQLDWVRQAVYEGDPEYFRGYIRSGVSAPMFISWYLYQFPLALAAFEAGGGEPAPIPNRIWERGDSAAERVNGKYLQRMPKVAFEKPAGVAVPINLSVWDDGLLRYVLRGPGGAVFTEGEWEAKYPEGLASARPTRDKVDVEIPADAPAGVYWLEVTLEGESSGPGRLYLPVTPPSIREVWVRDEPASTGVGFSNEEWNQYWFALPENEEVFEVDFTLPAGSGVRRVSIWNADWERVWDKNIPVFEFEENPVVRARVEVPESQRGRLWRVTLPGRNGAFRILSEVGPVFAISPDRWFDPAGS